MLYCDTSILGFLSPLIDGSREIVIVRLPGKWRKTHVHFRLRNGVNATALVVLAFQAKGIEHLHFVATLDIHTTVATALAACVGQEGRPEFQVQAVIPKLLL